MMTRPNSPSSNLREESRLIRIRSVDVSTSKRAEQAVTSENTNSLTGMSSRLTFLPSDQPLLFSLSLSFSFSFSFFLRMPRGHRCGRARFEQCRWKLKGVEMERVRLFRRNERCLLTSIFEMLLDCK